MWSPVLRPSGPYITAYANESSMMQAVPLGIWTAGAQCEVLELFLLILALDFLSGCWASRGLPEPGIINTCLLVCLPSM